jgi:hypothetical protein
MNIIKIVGSEVSANSTASAYSNNRLVKVVTPATNSVVTRAYSNGTAVGNTTLLSNTEYYLAKEPTDTFAFSANVLLTPVAWQ